MNLYVVYTDHGNVYAVKAAFSFEAVNKVQRVMRERVTCWNISVGMLPPSCKIIPDLTK